MGHSIFVWLFPRGAGTLFFSSMGGWNLGIVITTFDDTSSTIVSSRHHPLASIFNMFQETTTTTTTTSNRVGGNHDIGGHSFGRIIIS
jgi:hypothetical protein